MSRMPVRVATLRLTMAAALLLAACAPTWAQRSLVLVRHAEKLDSTDDPPLSSAGLSRAAALADLLREAGVTDIITTEYRRTQATAAPLARQLHVAPVTVPARQVDALVARLQALPPTAVALVVGHSNTLPTVLGRLGWTGTLSLGERDYDDVFIVVPRAGAEPSVLRLKYGRTSR